MSQRKMGVIKAPQPNNNNDGKSRKGAVQHNGSPGNRRELIPPKDPMLSIVIGTTTWLATAVYDLALTYCSP